MAKTRFTTNIVAKDSAKVNGGEGGGGGEIPVASPTRLGGIKVGDGLSITQDGTLSAEASGGNPYEGLVMQFGFPQYGSIFTNFRKSTVGEYEHKLDLYSGANIVPLMLVTGFSEGISITANKNVFSNGSNIIFGSNLQDSDRTLINDFFSHLCHVTTTCVKIQSEPGEDRQSKLYPAHYNSEGEYFEPDYSNPLCDVDFFMEDCVTIPKTDVYTGTSAVNPDIEKLALQYVKNGNNTLSVFHKQLGFSMYEEYLSLEVPLLAVLHNTTDTALYNFPAESDSALTGYDGVSFEIKRNQYMMSIRCTGV